jgi:hypothetical protein
MRGGWRCGREGAQGVVLGASLRMGHACNRISSHLISPQSPSVDWPLPPCNPKPQTPSTKHHDQCRARLQQCRSATADQILYTAGNSPYVPSHLPLASRLTVHRRRASSSALSPRSSPSSPTAPTRHVTSYRTCLPSPFLSS